MSDEVSGTAKHTAGTPFEDVTVNVSKGFEHCVICVVLFDPATRKLWMRWGNTPTAEDVAVIRKNFNALIDVSSTTIVRKQ